MSKINGNLPHYAVLNFDVHNGNGENKFLYEVIKRIIMPAGALPAGSQSSYRINLAFLGKVEKAIERINKEAKKKHRLQPIGFDIEPLFVPGMAEGVG